MLTGNGAAAYTVGERLYTSFVIMLGGFVQMRCVVVPVCSMHAAPQEVQPC